MPPKATCGPPPISWFGTPHGRPYSAIALAGACACAAAEEFYEEYNEWQCDRTHRPEVRAALLCMIGRVGRDIAGAILIWYSSEYYVRVCPFAQRPTRSVRRDAWHIVRAD